MSREAWTQFVEGREVQQIKAKAASVRVPTASEKCLWSFVFQCEALGVPVPVREHKFWPGRKFSFDCAWIEQKLALEVDGGVFMDGGGRHNRGAGYRRDCAKFAEAAILGWRVIRCLPEHVTNGQAIEWIRRAIQQ